MKKILIFLFVFGFFPILYSNNLKDYDNLRKIENYFLYSKTFYKELKYKLFENYKHNEIKLFVKDINFQIQNFKQILSLIIKLNPEFVKDFELSFNKILTKSEKYHTNNLADCLNNFEKVFYKKKDLLKISRAFDLFMFWYFGFDMYIQTKVKIANFVQQDDYPKNIIYMLRIYSVMSANGIYTKEDRMVEELRFRILKDYFNNLRHFPKLPSGLSIESKTNANNTIVSLTDYINKNIN